MHTNALRRIREAVEKGTTAALIGLMSLLSFMVLPVTASAAELTAESTSLSDPTVSHAATTYTFTQSSISLSAIKCIKVLFSVNADGTGGLPTGMSIAGATYNAGSSTYVPDAQTWTAATVSNAVQITNSTGETPASAGPASVVLTGITNGSTANTSFFATVSTYNSTDCSTAPVDTNGQSAYVFTSGVSVSATVNPTLTFTVGSTTCNLGTLTASTTGTCSHIMTAASNATSGYAISYIASTSLTNGTHTITANGSTAIANAVANEQFGLNLVANTAPSVGANKSGDTTPTVGGEYNIPNSFAFDTTGGTVATVNAPSALTTFTVSYAANITDTTPAGLYTKTQTYNITATY